MSVLVPLSLCQGRPPVAGLTVTVPDSVGLGLVSRLGTGKGESEPRSQIWGAGRSVRVLCTCRIWPVGLLAGRGGLGLGKVWSQCVQVLLVLANPSPSQGQAFKDKHSESQVWF